MLHPIELPVFVITLVANIALLAIVIEYAVKDRSRVLFSLFVMAQMLWISVNFFAFYVSSTLFLQVARLTLFFATFHAMFFYLFVSGFLPKGKTNWNRFIPIVAIGTGVAILTLTKFVFSHLEVNPDNSLSPAPGPLIPVFGIFVGFCVLAAIYTMISRFIRDSGEERQQWKFLTFGFVFTFLLVFVFSFFNFILFKNLTTVRFGHLYTLPFLAFTSYAMIKHRLLNIKAALAEIMVVILTSIIFIQFINSQSSLQFVISGLVFAGTLVVGVSLIIGVKKEIKQREMLQLLTVQLENANDKLQTLDKARAEFISIASHQLRTPPATIKWYLAAILGGDFGPVSERMRKGLENAQMTNNSLISLIDDLLNASRIERGKMEFIFEPTDLIKITQMTVDQLMPQALQKKQNLVFSKPEGEFPVINADREKLRQVINNLVDNAIKYTPFSGTVTVGITKTARDITLSVKDTGKGIKKVELQSIFNKYDRGGNKVDSQGLGLGLYVAKVVIEQHNGKIWAESSGEGKGSTFLVKLPIKSNLKAATYDLAAKKK